MFRCNDFNNFKENKKHVSHESHGCFSYAPYIASATCDLVDENLTSHDIIGGKSRLLLFHHERSFVKVNKRVPVQSDYMMRADLQHVIDHLRLECLQRKKIVMMNQDASKQLGLPSYTSYLRGLHT